MSKRFEERTVLITGAGSGLGQAAALQIARDGGKVSLVDLSIDGLENTKELIQKELPEAEVLLITADVSDEDAVQKFVNDTVNTFGSIDGFFNNAGIAGENNPTHDFGNEAFRKVLDVNVNGVFYGMKYVLEVMEKQGSGSIVNTSSLSGLRGGAGNQAGYAASKHAVIGLTKNAAIEYAQHGITVNAIAPWAILTQMVEEYLKDVAGDNWEDLAKESVSGNPTKKYGKPEDVGNLVSFLLSDEASYINAAVIPIDGGVSQTI